MKATIAFLNQTVEGKSLRDIHRKLSGMLRIEGPRGLTAVTETGAIIHSELYSGEDYIVSANGKTILRAGGEMTKALSGGK